MTIHSEISRIMSAKAAIKAAIEAKGVTVGDGLLDTYPEKVAAISTVSTGGVYRDENTLFLLVGSVGLCDAVNPGFVPKVYTRDPNGCYMRITWDKYIELSHACLIWDVGSLATIDLDGDFTVEADVQITSRNTCPTIITNNTVWSTDTFCLRYGSESVPYGGVYWNPADPLLIAPGESVPSTFKATHIAAVRKNGKVHYLVNLVDLTPQGVEDTRSLSFHAIAIGHSQWDGNGGYASMKINFVRISDVARYI